MHIHNTFTENTGKQYPLLTLKIDYKSGFSDNLALKM